MSSRPVIPRRLAVQDIDEAIEHLLDEKAGQAALGFVDELEQAYQHIASHPETGSLRYAFELDIPGLRFWPLKRHPYLVFYVVRSDCIDVWRVLHGQRDIPAWMREPEAP
ncbi:MAG: type II toxin-antitoxin system RelE/ParE family toxin [Rhodospirillales bacterium]|nr:type II toxin-antitoxin system RelE/ParE family toxin [Rhodospirillales bacterium]